VIAAAFLPGQNLASAVLASEIFVDVGEAWSRQLLTFFSEANDKTAYFSNLSKIWVVSKHAAIILFLKMQS
jgi:hypothetical protein